MLAGWALPVATPAHDAQALPGFRAPRPRKALPALLFGASGHFSRFRARALQVQGAAGG